MPRLIAAARFAGSMIGPIALEQGLAVPPDQPGVGAALTRVGGRLTPQGVKVAGRRGGGRCPSPQGDKGQASQSGNQSATVHARPYPSFARLSGEGSPAPLAAGLTPR